MASIRQTLAPARARLQKIVSEAQAFTSASPDDLFKKAQAVRTMKVRLEKYRETYLRLYSEWTSVASDDAQEEGKLKADLEQHQKILFETDDAIVFVNLSLDHIERTEHRAHQERLVQLQNPTVNAQPSAQPMAQSQPMAESQSPSCTVKLPQLELIRFDGDIMRYKEFWDAFKAAVHENSWLSAVEKFTYLKSLLHGEAKAALDGLAITNDNYTAACTILKERFGSSSAVINSHYLALTDLPPAPDVTSQIRKVVDTIEKHLRSLEALSEDVNHQHFVSMMKSKLPRNFIFQLESARGEEEWTVARLRKKIQTVLSAQEIAERHQHPNHSQNKHQLAAQRHTGYRSTTETLLASANSQRRESSNKKCHYCGRNNHWSDECRTYPTLDTRKQKVRGCCFICLSPRHTFRDCPADQLCVHCKKRQNHHRSLCPTLFMSTPGRSGRQTETSNTASARETVYDDVPIDAPTHPPSESSMLTSGEYGLLETAQTFIHAGSNAKSAPARVLLDNGSQRTYITQALAQKIQAKATGHASLEVFTFGSSKPLTLDTPVVKVHLKLLDGSYFALTANVVPKINETVPRAPIDVKKLSPLYATLPLAEPADASTDSLVVDLLLGNDHYWEIVSGERLEIRKGLFLIGSKLGWLLSGRIPDISNRSHRPSMSMLTSTKSRNVSRLPFVPADDTILKNRDLSDWWDLETIGIRDSPKDDGDEKASANFNETVKFEEGRYQVTWPWKQEAQNLPSNYGLALGHLNSLTRRLGDDPDLLSKYNEVIQTQLEKGIIEKVDDHDYSVTKKHYIPHHAVVTPEKTTKVRIVYDGSAKSNRSNPSVNECLYRGPAILEDLCHLLMRFRFHRVGLIADIEKAFLQVGLQTQERDVTRFLWLKNPERATTTNNLQIYRFTRVPFGIISSPFLLGATVAHHLTKNGSDVASNILKSIYVDNVITGTNTAADAVEFYKSAKALFAGASMNIREWNSNCPAVLNEIPEPDRVQKNVTTVLGLEWNTRDDTLRMVPKERTGIKPLTKRTVLKAIAGVFDPLGLISPGLLPAKLFLQKLWSEKMDWDAEVSVNEANEWRRVSNQLASVQTLTIPRYIGQSNDHPSDPVYQLHCFCDASQNAYGACVYIRISTETEVTSHLLFAKSRIAPTKQLTLPRLELLANVIGQRCLQLVERGLTVPIQKKFLWTDSQCTLHWIRSSNALTVFVSNRVKEIRSGTNTEYHYVPGTCNPADLVSRGTEMTNLRDCPIWWHGPPWLCHDRAHWPSTTNAPPVDAETLKLAAMEERPSMLYTASLLAGEGSGEIPPDPPKMANPYGMNITRYSSLSKLLRVTAWCTRFIRKVRDRTKALPPSLTAEELSEAKTMWVKAIQANQFGDVLHALEKGKRHPLRDQLGLWLDERGILRCKGRLSNAHLDENTTFPILLPQKSEVTRLVIQSYHKRLYHAGTSHTLSQIRHEFWIPAGRSAVHTFIQNCHKCKRWDGGPYKPPSMPDLPSSRVTKSAPFTWTGLDYLGPLYVKGNPSEQPRKVWVCLFTCMAVRAVHLELIEDLSAAQFLLCLRRFIARRGKPTHILSDNATTFKLAKTTLDRIWKNVVVHEDVQSYVSEHGIKWRYITERAPWMGGFYERLVRLVKQALRKSIQPVCLTSLQLQMVMAEIEAMLNSRPLVYVSSDPHDGVALTPSHFLSLNQSTGHPYSQTDDEGDPDYSPRMTSSQELLATWKKGKNHLNAFWKLWRDQYLLSLRERANTKLTCPKGTTVQFPHVDDVVLVKSDLPRGSWQIGRIKELCKSADGQIRLPK